MTTLADSFLEDLDELSGNSSSEEENNDVEESKYEHDTKHYDSSGERNDSHPNFHGMDLDTMLKNVAKKKVDDIAGLRKKEKYQYHMQQVAHYLQLESKINAVGAALEEDPEYQVIVASNDLVVEIDDEMIAVHRLVVDTYSKKFPELESLVPNALDYVHTVKIMKNEMDMTLVDLTSLLPSATIMGISVTGSTTSGKPLSEEDLKKVMDACDEVLQLEKDKSEIVRFLSSRMNFLAPNVSNIIGTRIAAQLMGLAGGLMELSRIPSCNLQVLGQQKKVLSGFSSKATLKHTGLIYHCDLVQETPEYLRIKASRVIAGKVALAARVDSQQENKDGSVGSRFFHEIKDKIEKWQEPQKAKTKKALPIPDEKPRRKRGGKRYRKMKERMQMTDVRKEANRMSFATADEDYADNAMGISYGRLGAEGSGNLRVIKKEQKQLAKKLKTASYASGSASATTSGLATSLAFTPVQGIELMNPEAAREKVRQANKKYFSSDGGFFSVGKK